MAQKCVKKQWKFMPQHFSCCLDIYSTLYFFISMDLRQRWSIFARSGQEKKGTKNFGNEIWKKKKERKVEIGQGTFCW
jgi:hypothetical protein